jgi:hypothetical protein
MPRKKPKNLATQKPHKKPTRSAKQTKKEPYFIVPRQEAPGCPIQRFDLGSGAGSGNASKLYHRTNQVAARRIIRHGFKDSTNYYLNQRLHAGVWLSSVPLDFNKGVPGQVLLEVDTDLGENELARYEWITQKDTSYREWLIPAAVVNPRMTVSVVR